MNVSGPLPIDPRRPLAAGLHPNQRFAAEVQQVTGEHVILNIAGVPIVARLTAPEQAAYLQTNQRAFFQVVDGGGPEVQLKLLASSTPPPAEAPQEANLISQLLATAGRPETLEYIHLARALIRSGLPVRAELIDSFKELLDLAFPQTGSKEATAGKPAGWGAREAQSAAEFIASGRILTPAGLRILLQAWPRLDEQIRRVRNRLLDIPAQAQSPELTAKLHKAMVWLDSLILQLPPQDEFLPQRVRRAIQSLGLSLEAELASLALRGEEVIENGSQSGPLTLAVLKKQLTAEGHTAAAAEFDNLIAGLRAQHFSNTRPFEPGDQAGWYTLELPCASTQPGAAADCFSVRLRIAREGNPAQALDHTARLRLEVEVGAEENLAVDLSIFQQRVKAVVLASRQELGWSAQAELAQFNEQIEKLGYQIQSSCVSVGPVGQGAAVDPCSPDPRTRSEWEA